VCVTACVNPGCTGDVEDVPSNSFKFVGQGNGGYAAVKAYSYVGDGAGEFEAFELKVYRNLRLRPWVWGCLAIAAALGLFGWLLWFLYTRNSLPFGLGATNFSSSSSSSSSSLSSGNSEEACGQHGCFCGSPDAWDTDRVRQCCQNTGVGCPADASIIPWQGVGQLVGNIDGCNSQCELDGVTADCKDRTHYTAKHSFASSSNSCSKALQRVIGDCPFCAQCRPEDSGCMPVVDPNASPEQQVELLLRGSSGG